MRKLVSVYFCILSRNIFEEGKWYQTARSCRFFQYFECLEVLTKWEYSWLWCLQSSPISPWRVELSIGWTFLKSHRSISNAFVRQRNQLQAVIFVKDLRTHHHPPSLACIHESVKKFHEFHLPNWMLRNYSGIHNERRYPTSYQPGGLWTCWHPM